jgi:phosphate starvation-inducible membrane PsiE
MEWLKKIIPKLSKGKLLKLLALLLDVGVPLAVTLSYFPLWVERSSTSTVSGVSLVLLFFCILPFVHRIKEWLKSPSVPVLWCIILAIMVLMRSIIDEMVVVCFFGAASNALGAVIHRVGESLDKE